MRDDVVEPNGTPIAGVRSRKQLERIVFADVEQQADDFFRKIGYCMGPDSDTCKNHSCALGTPNCLEYQPEDRYALTKQTEQMMLKLVSTGWCKPTRYNRDFCNEFGYCDLFSSQPGACNQLEPEDRADVLSLLRPREDGTYDFVDPDAPLSASPYRTSLAVVPNDGSAPAPAPEVTNERRPLSKRSHFPVHKLLSRATHEDDRVADEPSLTDVSSDSDRPRSLGPHSNGPLIRISVRIVKKIAPMFDALYTQDPYRHATDLWSNFNATMQKAVLSEMDVASATTGTCDQSSFTCQFGYCDMSAPICKSLTPVQMLDFQLDIYGMVQRGLEFGRCRPSSGNPMCQQQPVYCSRMDFPDDRSACQRLTLDETITVFRNLERMGPGFFALRDMDADSTNSVGPAIWDAEHGHKEADTRSWPAPDEADALLQARLERAKKQLAGHPSVKKVRKIVNGLPYDEGLDLIIQANLEKSDNTIGFCERQSATCNVPDCKLGTPGCRPMNGELAERKGLLYKQAMYKVTKTGRCEPSPENKAWCSLQGYCVSIGQDGHWLDRCRAPTEAEIIHISKLVEYDPDTETMVLHGDAEPPAANPQSSAPSRAGMAASGRDGAKEKHKVLVRRGEADEHHDSEEAGKDQKLLDHLFKYITYMQSLEELGLDWATAMLKDQGTCEDDSHPCPNDLCDLKSPGCKPVSRGQKWALKRLGKVVIFRLGHTGKCTPSHDTASFCNKRGYCTLGNDGIEPIDCRELIPSQDNDCRIPWRGPYHLG